MKTVWTKHTSLLLSGAALCMLLMVIIGCGIDAHGARITQLLRQPGKQVCAFFSPKDDLRSEILTLIDHEQRSIKIMTYTFTDEAISKALIRAHRSGIQVEIISDKGYVVGRGSKIAKLAERTIPIWAYIPEAQDFDTALMHNKLILFECNVTENPVVITGSCNLTTNAFTRNRENIFVIKDPELYKQCATEFEALKNTCVQISGTHRTPPSSGMTQQKHSWLQSIRTFFGKFTA